MRAFRRLTRELARKTFKVTFTENEYYILSKILNALNEKPEDYIHDCVVAMFNSDIDLNFGIESQAYKELHKHNEVLRELTAG